MKQDMIVILDLGSTENTVVARQIRDMGVYSEIHPHDITVEDLHALDNVKGIILNGGENRVVDGAAVDVADELYSCGLPMISIDHPTSKCDKKFDAMPTEADIKAFVFDECKAEANWNMKNFIEDQVELVRRQVGDKKVLLALSGGVDSSVVAALLLKAIGQQLVCVHVNHGLMRKGESEQVIDVFGKELDANLVYVDATDRFLDLLKDVSDPEKKRQYDQFGHAGVDPNYGAGGGGFGGFGGGFGGGSARSNPNAPRRGNDIQITVSLTFEEAAKGCKRKVDVNRVEICPECNGSGAEKGTSPTTCPECHGSRLNPEVLAVTIGGLNIDQFCRLSVTKALEFVL